MKKRSTRQDYLQRVTRVTRYIADHLFEDLDLETLAGVAAFSPYHFHRIYGQMVGETVTETIRRKRLHFAAAMLVETTEPLQRIAARVGYADTATFTRAFSQSYGVPPAEYRHRGQLRAPPGTVKHEDHSMSYDVNIDNRPAFRLAAMRHTGSYISIGRSFEEVSIWGAAQNAFRPDTQMVAVYWDDPETVPEAELRSDAGMTVPADLNIAGPVSEMQVPALRTASIVHVGPYAELGNAYRWLYGTWLPESGEEAGEYPPYEIYLNDPRSTAPADLRTWIHMPLV